MKATFARRARKLREGLQLTQERFAQLVGVTFQTVNRWEDGDAEPSGPTAAVLDALDKIVGGGKAPELLRALAAGEIAAGTGPGYAKLFSMAFGFSEPKSR